MRPPAAPPAVPSAAGPHGRKAFLKAAAAIITIGLVVFLKLDRLAGKWYSSADKENAVTITQPAQSRADTPASGPVTVVETGSLLEPFEFAPGAVREYPDLNFRFVMPADAWAWSPDPWSREGHILSLAKVPGKTVEAIGEASFSLRVLPLPGGPGSVPGGKPGPAVIEASLQEMGSTRITGREKVRLNDLEFSRLEVDGLRLSWGEATGEVWVCALNGMVFELTTAMPPRTPPYYVSQAARRMAAGFSVLNPAKSMKGAELLALLETAGAKPVPEVAVTFGNVSVSLSPETWTTWPGARNVLPGSALAFASRTGVRIAAAFTPAEGLAADPSRTAALAGLFWPALSEFQWNYIDRQPHDSQRTSRMRGTGAFGGRSGSAEVRAVRLGGSLMILVAFGPGDTKADVLTRTLDLFKVSPSANGDPDFGLIEDRDMHRRVLTAVANDATSNGRHEDASAAWSTLFNWNRDPADLIRAARSLAAAGKKDAAVSLLADNEGRHAGEVRWETDKLMLLASIGKTEESRRVAAGLMKNGGLPASAAAVYIETLMEASAFDEAKVFVKMVAGIDSSPVWHLYTAVLMAETGERSKAAAVIRNVRQQAPDDTELGIECVNVLMRCRLYPEALELAKFLAVKNPQREQMQILAAACHEALGHTADARESYQKILALNPASDAAKEALDRLAASSGQEGTDDFVAAVLQAVPLPLKLSSKLPPASAPLAGEDGQSVVHLYRITGVLAQPGIPLRQTVRGAVRVLDEEGMSQFNTMRFPVHPGSQRLCIHHLRVLDKMGKLTAEADLGEHYSMDGGAGSGMATSDKVVHIPVPGLTPGCTVEYAYTIENTGTSGAIQYTRHIFALPEACRMDVWYLTGDSTRLKFASSRNLQPERDGDSLVWLENRPALLTAASGFSGSAEDIPLLHIGMPSASWERLGIDYLDQIRDRLAASPAVTNAAHDAIAGLRTRNDRVLALTALVRDSISYTAIEFGARAVIPNPAAATLANRYGDCKDHSVLLHQLLTAAAIPSHLCLINSRGSIQSDFPCIAQFDHMIVALPSEDGKGYDFIDPTNKYSVPAPHSAPTGLENRTALILDRKGPVLASTPSQSAPSYIDVRRDAELRTSGDALFKDTISLTGTRAAWLRSLLAPLAPLERSAFLRQIIGFDRLSHTVRDIRIFNIKELAGPLRIIIQWEARRALVPVEGALRFTMPGVIESHLLVEESDPASGAGMRLPAPVTVRSETRLKLPPGHTVSPSFTAVDQGSGEFGKWNISGIAPGTSPSARISWECSLNAAVVSPGKQPAFIDFSHHALRRLEGDWELPATEMVKE